MPPWTAQAANLVSDYGHNRYTCSMWLHHLDSGYKLHKMNASKFCKLSRHSCLKTPTKSRKIKTSEAQSPKKRRRRHHHNRAGYQMRAYAYLGLSVVTLLWIKFGNTCDEWASQLVQRLLVQPFSNLPLHSRNSRCRAQLRLPLQNGRDSKGRPIASRASPKGKYSRPSPKSWMGRMLLIMLLVDVIMRLIQKSHQILIHARSQAASIIAEDPQPSLRMPERRALASGPE